MKDMIAHLTSWNRRLAVNLLAVQRGESELPSPWPAHLETTDATAILDGFSITDGHANGSAPANLGGGIYIANGQPVISHVTFKNNRAEYGGAIGNSNSRPFLSHVTATGNHATSGGGAIYNVASSPSINHTVMSGNSAGAYGGAVYNINSSQPTFYHVTISGNDALKGGGLRNSTSYPSIRNSILWGNRGFQIDNSGSTTSVEFSLVQNGYAGTGNMSSDPLFVDADGQDDVYGTEDDDLRLQLSSPVINHGNNTAISLDTIDDDYDGDTTETAPLDHDGNIRIVNAVIDMGAYEHQLPKVEETPTAASSPTAVITVTPTIAATLTSTPTNYIPTIEPTIKPTPEPSVLPTAVEPVLPSYNKVYIPFTIR
jgi:hypothetical protein